MMGDRAMLSLLESAYLHALTCSKQTGVSILVPVRGLGSCSQGIYSLATYMH